MLSELDKEKITRILKKKNKYIWNDPIILKVIEILNQLRSGTISKDDWFVPDVMTYSDYCFHISVQDFALIEY